MKVSHEVIQEALLSKSPQESEFIKNFFLKIKDQSIFKEGLNGLVQSKIISRLVVNYQDVGPYFNKRVLDVSEEAVIYKIMLEEIGIPEFMHPALFSAYSCFNNPKVREMQQKTNSFFNQDPYYSHLLAASYGITCTVFSTFVNETNRDDEFTKTINSMGNRLLNQEVISLMENGISIFIENEQASLFTRKIFLCLAMSASPKLYLTRLDGFKSNLF